MHPYLMLCASVLVFLPRFLLNAVVCCSPTHFRLWLHYQVRYVTYMFEVCAVLYAALFWGFLMYEGIEFEGVREFVDDLDWLEGVVYLFLLAVYIVIETYFMMVVSSHSTWVDQLESERIREQHSKEAARFVQIEGRNGEEHAA